MKICQWHTLVSVDQGVFGNEKLKLRTFWPQICNFFVSGRISKVGAVGRLRAVTYWKDNTQHRQPPSPALPWAPVVTANRRQKLSQAKTNLLKKKCNPPKMLFHPRAAPVPQQAPDQFSCTAKWDKNRFNLVLSLEFQLKQEMTLGERSCGW